MEKTTTWQGEKGANHLNWIECAAHDATVYGTFEVYLRRISVVDNEAVLKLGYQVE